MDCSPPGSSVHGIFQARILKWVAIFFSRGSSRPKGQTCLSCVSCIGKWILYPCAMQTIIISEKCPPIAERVLFDGEGESRKEEILDSRQTLLNLWHWVNQVKFLEFNGGFCFCSFYEARLSALQLQILFPKLSQGSPRSACIRRTEVECAQFPALWDGESGLTCDSSGLFSSLIILKKKMK